MTCERFLESLSRGADFSSAEFLEHLRDCPTCLPRAIEADPDLLFRSIGGSDLIPPGGVDAFVGDVMQQVRLRQTEQRTTPRRRLGAPVRWSVAAALALTVVGAAFLNRAPARHDVAPVSIARLQQPTTVRPVVENYANSNATVVQVPSGSDLQVVMIFDDKLPADL